MNKTCSICGAKKDKSGFRRPDQTQCIECLNTRERIRYREKMNDPAFVARERERNKKRMAIKRLDPKFVAIEREKGCAYRNHLWATSPEYREKVRLQKLEAYRSNPKARRARLDRNLKWAATPRGRHCCALTLARSRDGGASLTFEERQEIMAEQGGKCACCRREFSDSLRPHTDHIVSVKNGGVLTYENTQLLCHSCNSKKSSKSINFRNPAVK